MLVDFSAEHPTTPYTAHDTRERFEQMMMLYDEATNGMGKAHCISNLGKVAFYQHGYAEARQQFKHAIVCTMRLGIGWGRLIASTTWARLLLVRTSTLMPGNSSGSQSCCAMRS